MRLRIWLLILLRLTVERDNLIWLCSCSKPYTWPPVIEGSLFTLPDHRAGKEQQKGSACLGYTYVLHKPVIMILNIIFASKYYSFVIVLVSWNDTATYFSYLIYGTQHYQMKEASYKYNFVKTIYVLTKDELQLSINNDGTFWRNS